MNKGNIPPVQPRNPLNSGVTTPQYGPGIVPSSHLAPDPAREAVAHPGLDCLKPRVRRLRYAHLCCSRSRFSAPTSSSTAGPRRSTRATYYGAATRHGSSATAAPLGGRARAPSAWVANRGSAAHGGAGRPVVGARVAVGHTPALLAVGDRLRAIPRASARDMAGPRPPQIRHYRDVGRDSRDASVARDIMPPEPPPFLDCVSSSIELGVLNAGARCFGVVC